MKKKKDKHLAPSTLRAAFLELQDSKDPSDQMIFHTMDEWYLAKHPLASSWEVEMINRLHVSECPACHSRHIAKDGKNTNGIRRYRCQSCGKRFEPLTGTVFDRKKIPLSE